MANNIPDFITEASNGKLQVGFTTNRVTSVEIADVNDKGTYRIDFKFEKGGKWSTWVKNEEIESKTGKHIYRDNRGKVSIYVESITDVSDNNFNAEAATKCRVGENDLIGLLKVLFNYNKNTKPDFPTLDFSKLEEKKLFVGKFNLADLIKTFQPVVTVYGVREGRYSDVMNYFLYPYQIDAKNVDKTILALEKKIAKASDYEKQTIFVAAPLMDYNPQVESQKKEANDEENLPF